MILLYTESFHNILSLDSVFSFFFLQRSSSVLKIVNRLLTCFYQNKTTLQYTKTFSYRVLTNKADDEDAMKQEISEKVAEHRLKTATKFFFMKF